MRLKEPISLVVPVFQEEKNLPEFLAALQDQTLLPDEIIFIEAGSTDASPDLLRQWSKERSHSGPAVQILSNPQGFPGANRNRGIEKSRHPWVAFLDVRTIPQPEWLEGMSRLSSAGTQVAWLGKCRMEGTSPFAKAVCAVSYGYATSHTTLPGSMVQRPVFDQAGYFREDLRSAEDLVWMKKLRSSGLEVGSCREATIRYGGFPGNSRELRKKYWTYSQCGISIHHQPWIYLLPALFLVALTSALLVRPHWIPAALCLYLSLRGVADPVRRSKNLLWWHPYFKAFLAAPWAALQIDGTKAMAYLLNLAPKFGPKA